MNRLSVLLTSVLLPAVALPGRARACEPIGQTAHIVDASMKASDQTPPNLPAIPPPQIHRGDGSDKGGCGASSCRDVGIIWFDAVATDDTTPPERIGYRFTLAGGTLPAGFALPTVAIERPRLFWSADDGSASFDFTLQVVAIDLAGNESAPRTVRVQDDSGTACAVARGGASRGGGACVALLALLAAASRPGRRGNRAAA